MAIPRVHLERTYHTSPKAPIPTGCKSVYLHVESVERKQGKGGAGLEAAHLLVISNVVPKIWARTNSAMMKDGCNMLAMNEEWSRLAQRCNVCEGRVGAQQVFGGAVEARVGAQGGEV